jgi:hypothetical protein
MLVGAICVLTVLILVVHWIGGSRENGTRIIHHPIADCRELGEEIDVGIVAAR